MTMPSYQERYQNQIEADIAEDLARSEYKSQAIRYLAMAKNTTHQPDLSQAYALIASTYASLEESRWIAKGGKK